MTTYITPSHLPKLLGGTISAIVVAAALLLSWPQAAVAQDQPVKVNEADFKTYEQLRSADALARYKLMFNPDDVKKAAINAQWADALKTADWTQQRYDDTNSAVRDIISALKDLDKGGDDAENAKQTLAAADQTTVETVKAHLKEHLSDTELAQKAAAQVRDEADAELRGAAPDAKTLEGQWVMDIDATIDLLLKDLDAATKEKVAKQMRDNTPKATYTFGPDDHFLVTTEQNGATRTDEGTYRLEGAKIFFKGRNSKQEESLSIGIKDGQLRMGTMGAYSVFKKT
ncbi:MAG: hypothetical protein ABSB74_11595 [Tepidisphaeraceae bacterium]